MSFSSVISIGLSREMGKHLRWSHSIQDDANLAKGRKDGSQFL